MAQIRHLGLAHFLLNQGVLPLGKSLVEQLARKNIQPKDIDQGPAGRSFDCSAMAAWK